MLLAPPSAAPPATDAAAETEGLLTPPPAAPGWGWARGASAVLVVASPCSASGGAVAWR